MAESITPTVPACLLLVIAVAVAIVIDAACPGPTKCGPETATGQAAEGRWPQFGRVPGAEVRADSP